MLATWVSLSLGMYIAAGLSGFVFRLPEVEDTMEVVVQLSYCSGGGWPVRAGGARLRCVHTVCVLASRVVALNTP